MLRRKEAGDRPIPGRPPAHFRAFGMAVLAAGLWGLSGTAAQALFQRFDFPPPGLVTLRMLVSGGILLVVLRPRFPRVPLGQLLAFAVAGLFGVQITFFLAIDFSNAATTTLLQSLSLPMMAGYETLREGRRVDRRWGLAILLALVGTGLLIVGRAGLALAITPLGLLFGLLTAVAAAYYILAARPIVAREGSWATVTWGFLLGGLASLPFGAVALRDYAWPAAAGFEVAGLATFVVVFGTLIAFGLFLTTLGPLTATEAGVASTMEPITASLAALAFLGVLLTGWQYLGGALVLAGVFLLAPARGPAPAEGRGGAGSPVPPERPDG